MDEWSVLLYVGGAVRTPSSELHTSACDLYAYRMHLNFRGTKLSRIADFRAYILCIVPLSLA